MPNLPQYLLRMKLYNIWFSQTVKYCRGNVLQFAYIHSLNERRTVFSRKLISRGNYQDIRSSNVAKIAERWNDCLVIISFCSRYGREARAGSTGS